MLPLRIIFSIFFLYFCLFYTVAIKFMYRFITEGHSYGYLKSIGWTLGIHLALGAFAAYFIFKSRKGMGEERRGKFVTGSAVFFGLYVMSVIMLALSLPHA